MACAWVAFLSGDLLLWLAVPVLPDIVMQLGVALLLSASGVLLVSGGVLIAKRTMHAAYDYFSAPQRSLRLMLFTQHQQETLSRRFYLRKLKINFINDVKRQRLLKANDRKHLNVLSQTIAADLLAIKHLLPKATYRQLQQENSRHRRAQNSGALLALQQKIALRMFL
jgi:hypothetical protein